MCRVHGCIYMQVRDWASSFVIVERDVHNLNQVDFQVTKVFPMHDCLNPSKCFIGGLWKNVNYAVFKKLIQGLERWSRS